jgi:hypothetical protein
MPRIPNIPGPYRLYFFSADCAEPMHIHAERDEAECKFWLSPLRLAYCDGFSAAELGRIRDAILEHQPAIMEAWREHCR